MSNAMFVSKLDSRINDLIESGKVAVESATEKTSKHGTATRFVCTFDAEHAAGLFDETTGVNANKLTDRDHFAPVTLPLSFMDADVSDPKFNFHGADLIELSVYGWKKIFRDGFFVCASATFGNDYNPNTRTYESTTTIYGRDA